MSTCSFQYSPTNGTTPNVGRRASHRVSPDLCLGHIESMERKAFSAVTVYRRSCIDEVKLQCDVIPGSSVPRLELVRPSCIEDIEHVNAIKPHLALAVSLFELDVQIPASLST